MAYRAASTGLSRPHRALLAVASGIALALAFPAYDLPLFGWIAPALLILAVLNEVPLFAFGLGLLQAAVFYLLSVPWIYTVMRQYGPLPPPVAAGVMVLMVLVCSPYHAIFAAAVAWVSGRGAREETHAARACVAAPFLWVSAEFLMLHVPTLNFPWNLLGYAAAQNLAFVQLTSVTGIFGLSLIVAAYSALLAWIAQQWLELRTQETKGLNAKRLRGVRAWIAATVLLLIIAFVGSRFVPQASADHIAHLVQTNFPQSLSYPQNWWETHAAEMSQLEQISVTAAQKTPGLVVWPESPAPFSMQDVRFLTLARLIAHDADHGFLFGAVDFKRLPDGMIGATNSAALLDSSGALNFLYDKIHLVPFGEYVPWRRVLSFAGKLTADLSDFTPGSQYKTGLVPGGSASDPERFSVFICYEAIFPNEVRRFSDAGADLFVNLSNDGWFGHSSARPQHLAMARVRAVENRRWLLRDTNNGITASIDPYGHIVAQMPVDTRGELDAPYAFRSDLTFYARWGDWIAWLCVGVAFMLLLFRLRDAIAQPS